MPFYYEEPQSNQRIIVVNQSKRYGFVHFMWDCFWTLASGGLWLIWIFIREMRKR